jgi:hypothetical protein
MTERPRTPPRREPLSGRVARAVTLLITYAIKLVGLASAFNQLLLQSSPKAFPLAVAAFMMAGAQFSEGFVLSVLDRMMVTGSEARRQESSKEES